jgi:arylsulfatase A-like enzyme
MSVLSPTRSIWRRAVSAGTFTPKAGEQSVWIYQAGIKNFGPEQDRWVAAMKPALRIAISLMLLSICLSGVAASSKNILLIIADDYGADSSSLYNTNAAASLPPTPNINGLATNGLLFRNAYANPVCSPTRACLLTGRHSFRTGIGDVVGAGNPVLTAAEFTLPEVFAVNATLGYQLAHFGKWHLNNLPNSPNNIGGWPHFAGSLVGALANYTNWTKTVNGVSTANYTVYATTDLVNDAISWIQARGTQPWFAWVAFNAAHTPFHKPPNNLHSYDTLSGTQPNINMNPRPYYEAAVEAMDTEVGRLLAAVDRTNTHIIFVGDNGTPTQVLQPPYPAQRGKGTLYEGGIKVPLIVAGPAVVNPGRINDTPVHAVDLFSTILELGGINVTSTIPAGVTIDSQTLLPMLQETSNLTRCVYAERFDTNSLAADDARSLRNGQFKLIQFQNGDEEFYDLLADPYESANLLPTALNSAQQANYYSLVMRIANYQANISPPVVTDFAKSNDQFTISVLRTNNVSYGLWRASTLDDLAWVPVMNVLVTTNNLSTLTLTDTNATAEAYFYQVVATVP